jgi:hypothetical protein
MVSVLASSAVDRGFEPRSGKTKDYENDNCCFSDKALRRKSKDWLARNQNNVSEWSDMSIRGLFFSVSAYWSRTKRTSSSSHWKLTCCRHDIHLKNCWICAKQQPLNRSVCSCIAFNYTFGIYKLFLILVFIIIYFRYLSKSLKWLCDTYVCIYIYIYIFELLNMHHYWGYASNIYIYIPVLYMRLKIKANSVRIRSLSCQIFVLPSTGFELTPLIHCTTIR